MRIELSRGVPAILQGLRLLKQMVSAVTSLWCQIPEEGSEHRQKPYGKPTEYSAGWAAPTWSQLMPGMTGFPGIKGYSNSLTRSVSSSKGAGADAHVVDTPWSPGFWQPQARKGGGSQGTLLRAEPGTVWNEIKKLTWPLHGCSHPPPVYFILGGVDPPPF